MLAQGRPGLSRLVVNGPYLYYGREFGSVGRMNTDGTGDTVLGAQEQVHYLVLAPQMLVWGNYDEANNKGIRGCPLPDCPGGPVYFAGSSGLSGLTYSASSNTLYWAQYPDGLIRARAWPNGTESQFSPEPGGLVLAHEGYLYSVFFRTDALVELRRQALAQPGVAGTALTIQSSITHFAVTSVPSWYRVYWSNDSSELLYRSLQSGLADYTPSRLAIAAGDVQDVVTDSTHVYWAWGVGANETGRGGIDRCPLSGCVGVEPLATTTGRPRSLAVDEQAIYWVTETGSVQKLAKP